MCGGMAGGIACLSGWRTDFLMRIRDYVIVGMIVLWLLVVLLIFYKKKKSGKCIGCGGDCSSCKYGHK